MALELIRGLTGSNLVGIDIAEVSPPYDHAEITSLAGATIGLAFLFVMAANVKLDENKKQMPDLCRPKKN